MTELLDPIVLDLRVLAADAELSRPVAEALALAASVALDRLHGPRDRDSGMVHRDLTRREANIQRVPVDDAARATYADHQEATEEGAEAIAVVTARRALGRIVFRRLQKGTGADYLMRDPGSTNGDIYERLECSGIADGAESAAARLRAKLAQLARFPRQPPGYAIVTNFRERPVEIRVGSEQR